MNIPQPVIICMLGIVSVLSVNPIKKLIFLIKKTINRFRRRKLRTCDVLKKINEVTRMIKKVEEFNLIYVGVAAGIASPNASSSVLDGVRYTGGTISFIVCEGVIIFVLPDKSKFQI